MKLTNSKTRAQSAMEYLMTYGWAILIIAVVLAVLFSLNVFNAGAQIGTACVSTPGYSCSASYLNSAGQLTFTLGLATGVTVYNVLFSCVSNANTLIATSLPFNAISINGNGNTIGASAAPVYNGIANQIALYTITSGSQPTFSGIQCWGANGGSAISSGSPIGTSFTGTIWMAHTPTSGATAANTAYQYVRVAKISTKSTS